MQTQAGLGSAVPSPAQPAPPASHKNKCAELWLLRAPDQPCTCWRNPGQLQLCSSPELSPYSTHCLHPFLLQHLGKCSGSPNPAARIHPSLWAAPGNSSSSPLPAEAAAGEHPSPALPTLPGPGHPPEPTVLPEALPSQSSPPNTMAARVRMEISVPKGTRTIHPHDALFWLLWNPFLLSLLHTQQPDHFLPHCFPSPKQSCFPGCQNPLQPPEDQQMIFHSSLWFGEKRDLGSITIRVNCSS